MLRAWRPVLSPRALQETNRGGAAKTAAANTQGLKQEFQATGQIKHQGPKLEQLFESRSCVPGRRLLCPLGAAGAAALEGPTGSENARHSFEQKHRGRARRAPGRGTEVARPGIRAGRPRANKGRGTDKTARRDAGSAAGRTPGRAGRGPGRVTEVAGRGSTPSRPREPDPRNKTQTRAGPEAPARGGGARPQEAEEIRCFTPAGHLTRGGIPDIPVSPPPAARKTRVWSASESWSKE